MQDRLFLCSLEKYKSLKFFHLSFLVFYLFGILNSYITSVKLFQAAKCCEEHSTQCGEQVLLLLLNLVGLFLSQSGGDVKWELFLATWFH